MQKLEFNNIHPTKEKTKFVGHWQALAWTTIKAWGLEDSDKEKKIIFSLFKRHKGLMESIVGIVNEVKPRNELAYALGILKNKNEHRKMGSSISPK